MNSKQIQDILSTHKETKEMFLGVFPSDMIPKEISRYPSCFVCNVDSSNKVGSHWLAFFITSPNRVEFFDSYGNTPHFFKGTIRNFTLQYPEVVHNPLTLQSNFTAVCGQYTIYFLICRCRGDTMKKFLSQFVTQNICNDVRVYNFVAKRFRVYVNFYQ